MNSPVRYTESLEKPEPDEAKTGQQLQAVLHSIMETTSKDYGHAVRSVHAKSHAILQGTLTIRPGLDPTLAQGLFAKPGTHPVVMRISTIPGDVLDDAVSVPRGLAIKVLNVEGARLSGSEDATTQDFVMVNGPAFAAPKASAFLGNLKLLASTTDKGEWAKKALSSVMRGLESGLEAVGIKSALVATLGGQPLTNPASETYYSQTPFRYGNYVAKFSIAPTSPNLIALKEKRIKLDGRRDALREEITTLFAHEGGTWDLRVQLLTDPDKMPIEDASVVWPETASPFQPVATIEIKAQPVWTPPRARVGDDELAFSVWHGLAAHRPLGSINRVRKDAYKMSADFRAQFNKCPIHEPTELDLPA